MKGISGEYVFHINTYYISEGHHKSALAYEAPDDVREIVFI